MTDGKYASKENLTSDEVLAEDDFETMTGRLIRLKGLSRTAVLKLRKENPPDFEARTISAGLVAPGPEMTPKEVKAWQDKAPAGELDQVMDKITELSGLGPDAGKAAYKSVRDESGA
jgi:hypothetical protein